VKNTKRLTWGVILILGILVVVRLISSIPEAPETPTTTSPLPPSDSSPTSPEPSAPQGPTTVGQPKELATEPTTSEEEPLEPNLNSEEAHALTEARVKRVVDGDTILVSLLDGSEARVRYIGIDTPETVHPSKPVECFGQEASNFNKQLVGGKTVWLEFDVERYDRYNRLLAYVWLTPEPMDPEQNMANAILVKEGYAQAYTYPPNVKYSELFVRLQGEAREQGYGLWKACTTEGSASSQESEGSTVSEATSVKVYIDTILPNPFGSKIPDDEPWKEWVKICNAGSKSVELASWVLGDKQSSWTIPSGFTVPAQGCITITGKDYNPSGNTKGVFLNNSGDEVILKDADGKLIDRCAFGKVEQGQQVTCHL